MANQNTYEQQNQNKPFYQLIGGRVEHTGKKRRSREERSPCLFVLFSLRHRKSKTRVDRCITKTDLDRAAVYDRHGLGIDYQ